MKNIINISKTASLQLKNINKGFNNILFHVEGGGCNGLKYCLKPSNEPPKKRDELINGNGFKVVVCSKSLLYLFGTTIDWREDVMGNRFIFDNPNASSKCGCGSTFNI